MSDVYGPLPDNVDELEAEQYDVARKQLAALDTLPLARRQKFVLLQYWCQGCRELVAEVVDTRPWRTLRSRQHKSERVGVWRISPLPAQVQRPDIAWRALCKCSQRRLRESRILGDLDRGERKIELATRR